MKIKDVELTEWLTFEGQEHRQLCIIMEDPECYPVIVFERGALLEDLINGLRDFAMLLSDGPPKENEDA